MRRRLLTVAALTPVGVLGVSGLALAVWTVASTGATGTAAADTLAAPATVSTSNVFATSVTISVDAKPGTGPTPTSYRVDRTAPNATSSVCTISGSTGSCVDSSPVSGQTNLYAIRSLLGASWVSGTAATTSASVPSPDTTPPTLVSINRAAGATNPTNAGPLSFTVTFSEPVTGVTAARFALATSGTSGTAPTIGTPSPAGGSSPATAWSVAVSTSGTTGTNSGSIGLNMTSATGVSDAAGNALAGTGIPFTGQAFTYDTTTATLVSINRTAGATNPTRTGPLAFTVTFSEPVTGVTAARFALATSGTSGTAPTIGTPSPAGGSSPATAWSVAVSTTGTTGTNSGSIGLNMTSATGVGDAAGNALAGTGIPFSGQAFTYDTTAPNAPSASYGDSKNGAADVITGTAEANATITIVESAPTGHTYTGVTAANGTYSVSVDALAANTGHPISYSYTVTATDAAGNVSSGTTISGSDTA